MDVNHSTLTPVRYVASEILNSDCLIRLCGSVVVCIYYVLLGPKVGLESGNRGTTFYLSSPHIVKLKFILCYSTDFLSLFVPETFIPIFVYYSSSLVTVWGGGGAVVVVAVVLQCLLLLSSSLLMMMNKIFAHAYCKGVLCCSFIS